MTTPLDEQEVELANGQGYYSEKRLKELFADLNLRLNNKLRQENKILTVVDTQRDALKLSYQLDGVRMVQEMIRELFGPLVK